MSEKPEIIRHIEKFLGEMVWGYYIQNVSSGARIQVARFDNQPVQGSTTFVTTGVSKTLLRQPDGSDIRQELVFSLRANALLFEEIAKLLGVIANRMISSHQALVRGEVIGPAGPLIPGATKEALYVTYPVYFTADFHRFFGSTPQTSFVWLVPIDSSEIQYISAEGWSVFEDKLEAEDPDLVDINRPPIKITVKSSI